MKLIELQNIHKTYRLGEVEVPVLKGVSLSVSPGEFVALKGASGSGKTTLLNILGCLDRPTSGYYRLEGREVTALSMDERAWLRNQKLGFVFQTFNLLPRTSALENVMLPLSYNGIHLTEAQARHLAKEMLARVGLGERLEHEPTQLSGGEQQRVAIARALINQPALLLADEPTGNLDSKTSAEVLELFQRLNQEGVTIILVTHDSQVASYAHRVIHIDDGRVKTEEPTPLSVPRQPDVGLSDLRPGKPLSVTKLLWLFRTILYGLRRNLWRVLLTTLGIVIGIAAVIAMLETGQGSALAIRRTIASMGTNNLAVYPGSAFTGGVRFGVGSLNTLTPQDAEAIMAECPAVRAAAPVVWTRTQVIYENNNWVPNAIHGTTKEYLQVREWTLAQGEVFTDHDIRNANRVCLLGRRLVQELFPMESPLGKEVRVNNVPLTVIGILSPKGANMMGADQDDIMLSPWTTIKYRVTSSLLSNPNQNPTAAAGVTSPSSVKQLFPNLQPNVYPLRSPAQLLNSPLPIRFANVSQILAAAHSTGDIPAAMQQITQLLRQRHRLEPGRPDDFIVRDMSELTRVMAETSATMTTLLLVVALISLMVGGVGIMNIMLMSVTERTREIGVRLAVGAASRDILRQFLMEAVALCLIGGLLGLLAGRGVSFLLSTFLQWPTQMSPGAILAALLVSATVGIIFGYYPARKASRLDPIIALRYE